jgi:hypothetical protein
MARISRKLAFVAGSVVLLAANQVTLAQRPSTRLNESVEASTLSPADAVIVPAVVSAEKAEARAGKPQVIAPAEQLPSVAVEAAPAACTTGTTWCSRCHARWSSFQYWLHDCFLGFYDEFIPRPLGSSVYAIANTQVANAEAASMVLYNFDFIENSEQLNLRGKDQIAKVTHLLTASPYPLVIERTPYAPGLDQARRVAVLNELGQAGVNVPVERVVIGQPIALGLRGPEAEIVYQNLLINTQSGGTRAGAGGLSGPGIAGQGINATGR